MPDPPEIRAGSTLFPTPKSHLWIVVTDPAGEPAQVVIVNLTTVRKGSDRTVVLGPGDHPFVVRDTCVRYSDARLAKVETLQQLAAGPGRLREDVPPDVLRRIQDGLLRSPLTENWLKGYCRQQWE